MLGLHRVDRGAHRSLVRDVEGERAAAARLQLAQRLGLASGRVDGPAGGGEALGGRAADAGRAAGDERRAGGGRVGHGTETIGSHGRAAASRPALGHRRGFLAQEKPNTHMHIGGLALFEGEPPRARRVPRAHRVAPASRPALPAEARRRRRSRPAGRCGSTTRTSTSPTTCATRRCRRRVTRTRCSTCARAIFSQRLDRSKPLWELWLVEGLERAKLVGFALRLEDPPRGRRRRVGRRPLDRAVRPLRRGASRRHERRGEPWVPQPEPTSAELAARGLTGAVRAAADVATRRARRRSRARARRSSARARSPRASARSRGPRSTTRPTRRSTCRRARTAGSRSCARASTSSSSSRTRSAPPSTTSCSRW